MRIESAALALLVAVLAPACAYPEPAKVEQLDQRPSIGIRGAPEGATLFVDGLDMGPARQFDGETNVLLVESGTHLVEVKDRDGNVLHSESLFLSNSTRKILQIQP